MRFRVALVLLGLLGPGVAMGNILPLDAVFPPRDPNTAGIVGVIANGLAEELMICGLRSSNYANAIGLASSALYVNLPADQREAARKLVGDPKNPNFAEMGLLPCRDYLKDNKFSHLIDSMDRFVMSSND